MFKSSRFIILGFAIAIITVLMGFFMLRIERTPLYLWALGFLVLSMIISMALNIGMMERDTSDKDKVLDNAGTAGLVWIYQLSVIISVVFTRLFENKIYQFIFLQVVIIAIFSILMLLVNHFSMQVHTLDRKTLDRQENNEYSKPKRGGY